MGTVETFEVGVVAGAHGLGGALRIHLFDAASRALDRGCAVRLRRTGAAGGTTITVRRSVAVPGKPGTWRVESDDVRDRDAALALAGCVVEIDRASVAPAADDEFFLADAIGLPVLRARPQGDPVALGMIVGVTSNGAQDLFEVSYRGANGRTQTWLLPVLPHVIRDVTKQAVWVDPPLGLVPDELEDGA
jgi:16S rRNA processing protein RimM